MADRIQGVATWRRCCGALSVVVLSSALWVGATRDTGSTSTNELEVAAGSDRPATETVGAIDELLATVDGLGVAEASDRGVATRGADGERLEASSVVRSTSRPTPPTSSTTSSSLAAGERSSTSMPPTAATSRTTSTTLATGPAPATPDSPVTTRRPLTSGRDFVSQSVSFVVSSSGTVSSRRPLQTEPQSTSLYRPAHAGVPAGLEWRVLWLRARNCDPDASRIEFFVHDEASGATVRRFTQSATTPVEVAPSGDLAWTESIANPLILRTGQSIGVRFHDMRAGSRDCNWQFAAIEQPAGTGLATRSADVDRREVGASFPADRAGLRASWRTAPAGEFWLPEEITAVNCESAPRAIEAVVLAPGNITMATLHLVSDGSGPNPVDGGSSYRWNASERGDPRLVIPPGWSLGVRWLNMTGDAPENRCTWNATVSAVPLGLSSTDLDSTLR